MVSLLYNFFSHRLGTRFHFIASGEHLSEKVRLFKSYSARKTIDYLKENQEHILLERFVVEGITANQSDYQLWQKGFHPKQILGDKMMVQKMEYIHKNPVKAGYVDKAKKWKHSSIQNYLDGDAPLEITCFHR